MSNAGLTASSVNDYLRNLNGSLEVEGVAMGSYEDEDVTVEFELEHDAPTPAGTIGTLINSEWVIACTVRLGINLKEFAHGKLSVIMGDLGYSTPTGSEQIGGAALGERNYLADVVFSGMSRGSGTNEKAMRIEIDHAVCDFDTLNFSKTTGNIPATFESRVDPTAPRTLQARILIATA